MNRRNWIMSAFTILCGGKALHAMTSRPGRMTTPLTVYKDPSCGCCIKWVAHVRSNGFEVTVHDRTDMDSLKDSLGVPSALRSCHTAVAGKFLVEGHVPAADLQHLLATRPAGVLGLAVPGMPSGSPGMETAGRADRFDVLAFGTVAKPYVFATHG